MKEIAAACAAYFQEHPAYHRILVLLFQKVKSFEQSAWMTPRPRNAMPPALCLAALSPRPSALKQRTLRLRFKIRLIMA